VRLITRKITKPITEVSVKPVWLTVKTPEYLDGIDQDIDKNPSAIAAVLSQHIKKRLEYFMWTAI
jgi:hypothetical protein